MTIKCEFYGSPSGEEAEICMSCFEAGRSQAPDASQAVVHYGRLVRAADALVARLDRLSWASEEGSLFTVSKLAELVASQAVALRAVLKEVF